MVMAYVGGERLLGLRRKMRVGCDHPHRVFGVDHLAHEDISAPSQFGECLAWPGIPAENDYAAWSFEPVRKGLVPSRIERLIVCILRREYLDPAIRLSQPSDRKSTRLNYTKQCASRMTTSA